MDATNSTWGSRTGNCACPYCGGNYSITSNSTYIVLDPEPERPKSKRPFLPDKPYWYNEGLFVRPSVPPVSVKHRVKSEWAWRSLKRFCRRDRAIAVVAL